MTIHCHNDTDTAAAFERVKREGLRVVGMAVMPRNNAGWILTTTEPPMQRELITDAPQGKQGATVGSVVGGSNFQIVDTFPTGRPSSGSVRIRLLPVTL